jgi:protocatechuate 3,4-dioxygenase beta subunit
VIPGGYTDDTGCRAPHINLTAMGAGLMRRVLTTVFFPEYPTENAADPMLALVPEHVRGRLMARLDGEAGGLRIFRFDIRLRGSSDEETPFFED